MNMNNKRILSGYEIVAKGATKTEATLPELGIKEVFPNKSWLEDKQIQAAIEARKHLIEVERIDKSGALSHAVWREELMLAEVMQNVGSCWQYLGHNAEKKLFLKPEEALFLLESNCLCLKHNDVKVSLQQAYTLLLRDKITLLQYKVYASLSRVGYRVYRHTTPETSTSAQKIDTQKIEDGVKSANKEEVGDTASENKNNDENQEHGKNISNLSATEELQEDCMEMKQEIINQDSTSSIPIMHEELKNKIKHKKLCGLERLRKLKNRQLKPCNIQIIHKYFESVPELLEKNIVTVKAPDKQLLPNTINLTKPVYKVNLLNIQKKERSVRPSSNESNIYSVNDEVNGSHIRRLRSTSNRTESNTTNTGFASNAWTHSTNTGFATQNPQYRPFVYWRPRQPFNYYNFNMLFQRPFLPSWHFAPNFYFYPRAQPNFWRQNFYNTNRNNNTKRTRKNAKKQHLDGILKLAARLKQLIINGNTHEQNIYSLQRLIQTYNTRYKTKVRLNERFDIVVDETIVDTITLDDDDEGPSSKRRKPDPLFEENLNNLKLFGLRLKDLEYNDKSSGKHRRAFSKLLKTFNESYNEDYYLNEDYELACRNQIDLDSSNSDLDCVIEEIPTVSGKKLKNPFNILKRLSEMQKTPPIEVTPKSNENTVTVANNKYSKVILNTFTRSWLPGEDDFGRAEIISNDACCSDVTDIRREEFLYDFIKIQTCKFDNWLDLKKSFFSSIQAAIVEFQNNMPNKNKMGINSIVKPGDCADMASVLKKLSIIKTDKAISDECNLAIDFDVYNRNVQNFKKSNRPTPHFRIICIDESIKLPPGNEIAALHSKYGDQVTIVFAVVGTDSISYVQVNPTVLPVYISNNT
ncbi:uncharacterized protein LOC123872112 [Maniola jurtina]|uniref:uncharacterized protein LOC123872112 n=1 Tax=Maniola jurtina TaxID=191418 RepID=UPI001E686E1D|nr:uncharacterized protein LOC123872112 [Maniola jurtina]